MAEHPSEHLTHGWEPDLEVGDSLLRRFVHAAADRVAFLAEIAGGRVERAADVVLGDAASPAPYDNGAVLLQPPAVCDIDDVVQRLDEAVPRSRGFVLLSAWALPDLRPHGLELMGHPPFMFRPAGGAAPPLPAGLDVVEVRTPDERATFARAITEGYPMPGGEDGPFGIDEVLGGPVRLYLGLVDGKPIATAGACVAQGLNDVEWVSTMPDARRRGYGEALTWAATFADPTLPSALIASDLGQAIYQRMGYVSLLRMTLWWRPPRP
jgi:hypothetical protein